MSNSGAFTVFFIVTVVYLVAASASVSAAGRETPRNHRHYGRLFLREEAIRMAMAGYGEEKLSTVVVTGNLLCAACSSHRPQLLPISGALVAVTCNLNSHYKSRNKKPTWIKGTTGENGEFIIDLPSHLHAIPNINKACSVKVLHLPKHSPCRSALTLAKRGAHPIVLSYVGNGIRTYTTGTVQFLYGDLSNPKGCKRVAIEPRHENHGSY